MSIEWIVLVVIALAALVVGLVTLITVADLRRALQNQQSKPADAFPPVTLPGGYEPGNVFCRGCGNMYDSTLSACPSCRMPRV